MIILTGVSASSARPAPPAGIVTPVPAPVRWHQAKAASGTALLEAPGPGDLPPEVSKALGKSVKVAIAELGPAAKGAVKGYDLYQSAGGAIATWRAEDRSWFAIVESSVDAADDLVGLVQVAAPRLGNSPACRLAGDALELAAQSCKVYAAATAKPDPPFGLRSAP